MRSRSLFLSLASLACATILLALRLTGDAAEESGAPVRAVTLGDPVAVTGAELPPVRLGTPTLAIEPVVLQSPATLPPATVNPPPGAATPVSVVSAPAAGRPGIWLDNDLLLWWMRSASLPPLVSGAAPGTPLATSGVLGTPGSGLVFGNQRIDENPRAGWRIRGGVWLDDDRTCGLEAEFFMLETNGARFGAGSDGSTILARPFFNAITGAPGAQLIAFPGLLAGAVGVDSMTTGLLGAGIWGRQRWCCWDWSCPCGPTDTGRLDGLLGYRFFRFSDRLGITENLVTTAPVANIPLGTQIGVTDQFSASNQFHGLDLGLTGERRRGPWVINTVARLGLGWNLSEVDITGARAVTVPGFPTNVQPGGLLALQSNIGTHRHNEFTVLPELGARLGYQLTPALRLYVGYDLIYWFDVLRAGQQIDPVVNPLLLPPPVPGATPLRPAFAFHETDLWVQGISFGVQWRY